MLEETKQTDRLFHNLNEYVRRILISRHIIAIPLQLSMCCFFVLVDN